MELSPQSGNTPPGPAPLDNLQRPCLRCKKGKRKCQFVRDRPGACTRCSRLGYPCSGPDVTPPVIRKPRQRTSFPETPEVLPDLNLAPSCTRSTLGRFTLASAFTYELVRAYKEQVSGLRYLDADLVQYRLDALAFSGRISRPEEIGELKMLLYLVGGAKLSSHSTLIGTQKSAAQIGSFADYTCSGSSIALPDRRRMGFLRQTVLQDLSERLILELDDLLPRITSKTLIENFSFICIAIRELGAAGADPGNLKIFCRRLRDRISEFRNRSEYRDLSIEMVRILARDPATGFHGFLESGYLDEDFLDRSRPRFPVKAFETPSTSPFQLLSTDQLSQLTNRILDQAPVKGDITFIIQHLRSGIIKRQRDLIDLLLYDCSYSTSSKLSIIWSEFDQAQSFFQSQTRQALQSWQQSPLASIGVPKGLTTLLNILFKLQSTHVLFTWVALRETSLRQSDLRPFKDRFHAAITSWVSHMVILMDYTTTRQEAYDLGVTVTESVDFMKGAEVEHWSLVYPEESLKLLRILNYVSFALPNAGKLIDALRNPTVDELEQYHLQSSAAFESGLEDLREANMVVMKALEDVSIT